MHGILTFFHFAVFCRIGDKFRVFTAAKKENRPKRPFFSIFSANNFHKNAVGVAHQYEFEVITHADRRFAE